MGSRGWVNTGKGDCPDYRLLPGSRETLDEVASMIGVKSNADVLLDTCRTCAFRDDWAYDRLILTV